MRRRRCDERVIYLIAARWLDYPTAELISRTSRFADALDEQPDTAPVRLLRPMLAELAVTDLAALQRAYVDCFDLNSKRALYLSYWTDGDTRRRGAALAEIQAGYRAAGAVVDTRGELPDYLPIVLEFAAGAPIAGRELLSRYRAGLELLRISLQDSRSPYAAAVAAVCATLPGDSPADRAAAHAMASPPTETVGLDLVPYGGRR